MQQLSPKIKIPKSEIVFILNVFIFLVSLDVFQIYIFIYSILINKSINFKKYQEISAIEH